MESTGDALKVELRQLRAAGLCDSAPLLAPDYFPFVDAYGQFWPADWPTKIHAPDDFAVQRAAEVAALRANKTVSVVRPHRSGCPQRTRGGVVQRRVHLFR